MIDYDRLYYVYKMLAEAGRQRMARLQKEADGGKFGDPTPSAARETGEPVRSHHTSTTDVMQTTGAE